MNRDMKILLNKAAGKLIYAVELLEASLLKVGSYDPARDYSPEEREPYDAMSDRYMRAVELALKYFKTYELAQYAENSDTLRDLLNRLEKSGLISTTERWMAMREIRNRIIHDYLPGELKDLYDLIGGEYGRELIRLKTQIQEK